MTARPRPALALALALPLLACDQGGLEPQPFRSTPTLTAPATTVRLGVDLDPVRVTSYSIGGALADALSEDGFDALLAGAAGPAGESQLVLRLDGVNPVAPADIDDAFVQLQREDEVLDYPYSQFNFKVEVDSSGQSVTVLVLAAAAEDGGDDFTPWHSSSPTSAPPPGEAVETIEYEMLAADGTSTRCRAEPPPVDQLSLGYTRIEGTTGVFEFEIAEACAGVLEAAADSSPPHAFFVRCDRTTTTASIDMHKLSDVTLKRGVITGVGELKVESSST